MENNVYLSKEQKFLIMSLVEDRHRSIKQLEESVMNQELPKGEYEVITRSLKLEIDKLNQICRAVYRS